MTWRESFQRWSKIWLQCAAMRPTATTPPKIPQIEFPWSIEDPLGYDFDMDDFLMAVRWLLHGQRFSDEELEEYIIERFSWFWRSRGRVRKTSWLCARSSASYAWVPFGLLQNDAYTIAWKAEIQDQTKLAYWREKSKEVQQLNKAMSKEEKNKVIEFHTKNMRMSMEVWTLHLLSLLFVACSN